jgi:protein-tyrosine phosphatase
MPIINLVSVRNMRELRGLRAIDGRAIQARRLIRSAELFNLSSQDACTLVDEYSLVHIIDLRTEGERGVRPDQVPDAVRYSSIPLLPQHALSVAREASNLDRASLLSRMPDVHTFYEDMVAPSTTKRWRAIFSVFLHEDTGAVLWHCAGGKDRCGMVAAILELALGISLDEVRADYLATNVSNELVARRVRDEVFEHTQDGELAHRVSELWAARDDYLDAALGRIEREYGGIAGFLEQICGVDKEARLQLQENYL